MEGRVNARINVLTRQIAETPASGSYVHAELTAATAGKKSDDDVVVVASYRTAVTKAKRGAFKELGQEQLLAPVFKHLLTSTKVDPKLIGDIVIGNVLPRSSQGATEVRIAALLAGYPQEVGCMTVNRQCSSGLQAIATVANAIKNGEYDFGVAGGVEIMSINPMSWEGNINEEALAHPLASGCYQGMGQTSENVAERFNISRKDQDEFAAESHKRAAAAQAAGKTKGQIVPVEVKNAEGKVVVVDKDEGIRADTTAAGLGKLKPAFKEDGTTTAGNSSQVSDGAAACLLARRSAAVKAGLPILASFRSFASVGVEPSIMGVGPAYAIPEAVKRAGVDIKDVDVFEINEAFASQALYSCQKLKLDMKKVNPNGGAIALGHPLGCTGARQLADLLPELKRQKGKYGVISMCIGSGMGAAAVFENEQQ